MRTAVACVVCLLSAASAAGARQGRSGTVGAAHADAAAPAVRLTLEEALDRGLASSYRLAELEARRDAAGAAAAGRQAAARPLVSMAGSYLRTNHVEAFGIAVPGLPPRIIYPDIPDNLRARLDLQWPIYTGGRTAALERAAGAERAAADGDVAAARADLRLEITRAFWALVTARETETVVAASVRSLDTHLADLRSRFTQGLIPPNEVSSAETEVSRGRGLAIEASSTRAIAEADLQRLLGLEGEAPIEPVGALAPPAEAGGDLPAGAPAAMIARALTLRPERRALGQRIEVFKAREAAAAAANRPQVALGAGYDYARPNPRIFPRMGAWRESWDASVSATWLLFDGGRRRAEVAEALAGVRGAEAKAAEFDRQAGFEVRQRRLELEASRTAVGVADAGVASAAEARRVVGERFTAGVAITSDVLDAELALLQARLDRTRTLANLRLAEARLRRALGQ